MTSKDTTAVLTRASVVPREIRQAIGDSIAVIAFGLIQWPWLLRSLYGGSKIAKAALLDRLCLPSDALPNLGSWKADVGLLSLLAEHVISKRPATIVEFGTGASTLVLAKALEIAGGGHFISFDEHIDFVIATRNWLAEHDLTADIREAPLLPTQNWPGLWYAHGELPQTIDLLFIDGPPWTIHPFTRGAADRLFGRVSPGGTIILDDAARPGERLIASRWRRDWPDFDFHLVKSGAKGTLIGRRRCESGGPDGN